MNNEMTYTFVGKHTFYLAMKLAFTDEYDNNKTETVCGYSIYNNTLYLHSYVSDSDKNKDEYVEFPFIMNLGEAISFSWGWLYSTRPLEKEPDTDGTVKQGFTITTENTNWRGKFSGSFIAIKPAWVVYGK